MANQQEDDALSEASYAADFDQSSVQQSGALSQGGAGNKSDDGGGGDPMELTGFEGLLSDRSEPSFAPSAAASDADLLLQTPGEAAEELAHPVRKTPSSPSMAKAVGNLPSESTDLRPVSGQERREIAGEEKKSGGSDTVLARSSQGPASPSSSLQALREEVSAAREVLYKYVGNEAGKADILELAVMAQAKGVRAAAELAESRKKETDTTSSLNGGGSSAKQQDTNNAPQQQQGLKDNAKNPPSRALEERIEALERELRAAKARNVVLEEAAGSNTNNGGGGSLSVSLYATEDVRALKSKALQLVERARSEKLKRLRADAQAESTQEKVNMLSDHVEKLMLYLKQEALGKAKTQEKHRRAHKEAELAKARCQALVEQAKLREDAMTELREGAKVLEDQLRLMDEKYVELRAKLDWTRTRAAKDVKKAQQAASNLRAKYAMAFGSANGTGPNSAPLLDELEFPTAKSAGSSAAPNNNRKTDRFNGAGKSDNRSGRRNNRNNGHGATSGNTSNNGDLFASSSNPNVLLSLRNNGNNKTMIGSSSAGGGGIGFSREFPMEISNLKPLTDFGFSAPNTAQGRAYSPMGGQQVNGVPRPSTTRGSGKDLQVAFKFEGLGGSGGELEDARAGGRRRYT